MNISLPSEKLRKIQQEVMHLLKEVSVSIRQIAAFIGMTNAVRQAIPVAPMYHRQLPSSDKQSDTPSGPSTTGDEAELPQPSGTHCGSRRRATWWSQAARNHNAAPIIIFSPDLVIETDASLVGWGARCMDQRTGGPWSVKEQKLHINALELTAVLLAIQTFTKERKHQHILVRTDNTTAKFYINHIRGTHSPTLNAIALSIWNWCLERHLHLSAEYLLGVENQIVDAESTLGRPLRLDASSTGVQADKQLNGSTGCGSHCVQANAPITKVFQLEARPGSGGHRHVHTGLESDSRLCKSPVVSDSGSTDQNSSGGSKNSAGGSSVENPASVSSAAGHVDRCSLSTTTEGGPSNITIRKGVHYASGGPTVSRMAIVREKCRSGGLSAEASQLVSASLRSKSTSSYESLFRKWNSWCMEQSRNPT